MIERIFAKKGSKLLLFLFSYMIAIFIASNILSQGTSDYRDLIFGLALFPFGFSWYFSNTAPPLSMAIGWVGYIVITLWAVFIKNSRAPKILFVIFVALLILNIVGCAHIEDVMPCCL